MKENTIAKIFQVMGFITFIGGLIVGGMLGSDPFWMGRDVYKFSIMHALVYWIASFFSGMLCLAIAEVIELLEVSNKTVK